MKIILSSLPNNSWWGHGTPEYDDNPAMNQGVIPDQMRIKNEWNELKQSLLLLSNPLEIISFPKSLDSNIPSTWKHDYVFMRDLFISNQCGDVVIARFREKERQAEEEIIETWLSKQNLKVNILPFDQEYYMEGGEFYYCPNEKILFAGSCRNNAIGNIKTAELLNVKELIQLESNAFHLDTIFTPVFNHKHELCLMICCTQLLKKSSLEKLKKLSYKTGIELLDISLDEAIGSHDKLGSFAVNCLPTPGNLIGASKFTTNSIKIALIENKINHTIVPLTQFHLSGGSAHCLTNEL